MAATVAAANTVALMSMANFQIPTKKVARTKTSCIKLNGPLHGIDLGQTNWGVTAKIVALVASWPRLTSFIEHSLASSRDYLVRGRGGDRTWGRSDLC